MLNQCNFIGRLGKDPITRHIPEGDCVVNFSMALDESYKKDGVKVEKTEWINVVAFRKLAEVISKYVGKGDLIFINGKIQTRKYQGEDGHDKYITEIVADKMKMLGNKEKTESKGTASFDELENDLPF